MAATIDLTTERWRRRTPSSQKLITRYGGGTTLEGYLNTAWSLPSHQARYPGNPALRIKCETWNRELSLCAFSIIYDRLSGIAHLSSLLPSDDVELDFAFWPKDHKWYLLDHYALPATIIAI